MNSPRLSIFKAIFTAYINYMHTKFTSCVLKNFIAHISQFFLKNISSGLVCYRTVTDNEFSPSVCRPKDVVSKWTNEFLDCWNDPKCVLPL